MRGKKHRRDFTELRSWNPRHYDTEKVYVIPRHAKTLRHSKFTNVCLYAYWLTGGGASTHLKMGLVLRGPVHALAGGVFSPQHWLPLFLLSVDFTCPPLAPCWELGPQCAMMKWWWTLGKAGPSGRSLCHWKSWTQKGLWEAGPSLLLSCFNILALHSSRSPVLCYLITGLKQWVGLITAGDCQDWEPKSKLLFVNCLALAYMCYIGTATKTCAKR